MKEPRKRLRKQQSSRKLLYWTNNEKHWHQINVTIQSHTEQPINIINFFCFCCSYFFTAYLTIHYFCSHITIGIYAIYTVRKPPRLHYIFTVNTNALVKIFTQNSNFESQFYNVDLKKQKQ